MSEDVVSPFWYRKKEPRAIITRPFGQGYHVNIEYDMWSSHVGVFFFKSTAMRKARKALRKKIDEYYSTEEKQKMIITETDLP